MIVLISFINTTIKSFKPIIEFWGIKNVNVADNFLGIVKKYPPFKLKLIMRYCIHEINFYFGQIFRVLLQNQILTQAPERAPSLLLSNFRTKSSDTVLARETIIHRQLCLN